MKVLDTKIKTPKVAKKPKKPVPVAPSLTDPEILQNDEIENSSDDSGSEKNEQPKKT